MKHHSHKNGFNLIELMIVIAIIGILAAFSIPNYYRYLAKAKQTEVSLNLTSLYAAQQLYFLEHNTYCHDLTELGWEPAGKKSNSSYYSYGFRITGGKEGKTYFKGVTNIEDSKFPKTHANTQSFKACAVGDISGKGSLDIWTIDETNTINHVVNGI